MKLLSIIFECSWQLEEAPKNWRKTNITPLFKKGKKENTGNYRLVNLTLITGRVIEQLIRESISRHVKDEKVIRSDQQGFTMGKSCFTNFINFL